MSTNVSLFFNYPNSLLKLKEELNEVLGVSFAPYEGAEDDLYCRFLGMEFSLQENDGYTNDRELNFEDYRYSLDLKIPSPDNDLACLSVQTLSSVAYVLYARMSVCKSMMVYDMQKLIARYNYNSKTGFFDELSEKQIEFPEHAVQVSQRAWNET